MLHNGVHPLTELPVVHSNRSLKRHDGKHEGGYGPLDPEGRPQGGDGGVPAGIATLTHAMGAVISAWCGVRGKAGP